MLFLIFQSDEQFYFKLMHRHGCEFTTKMLQFLKTSGDCIKIKT